MRKFAGLVLLLMAMLVTAPGISAIGPPGDVVVVQLDNTSKMLLNINFVVSVDIVFGLNVEHSAANVSGTAITHLPGTMAFARMTRYQAFIVSPLEVVLHRLYSNGAPVL